MNYNLKVKKLQWEQQISKEYEKYQVFIGDTNMPKYKVDFIEELENISYSMRTLTFQRPVVLKINVGFMISGDKHCQSTLFHEFTHMWDSENIFVDKDSKLKKKALYLYTEYHAAQIGFLRFIESYSISDVNKVNLNDSFYKFDEKFTVKEYYDNKCSLLKEAIVDYNKDKTPENYLGIINSYMYILGIKNIYDQYIVTVDIPNYNDIFYNTVLQLYDCFKKNVVDDYLWESLLKFSDILEETFMNDVIQSMTK